jgi:hypothetical protein
MRATIKKRPHSALLKMDKKPVKSPPKYIIGKAMLFTKPKIKANMADISLQILVDQDFTISLRSDNFI